MKQSPTVLHLLNCHTASLTMRQDSHSQAVSKVQATPRSGQNDRLSSDALTKFQNGDSPFMFDFTQTMVLIKVLLSLFIYFTVPVRDNRYADFLYSGHWSNCGCPGVNNRNVCRNTVLFHRLRMVHDNRYQDFFDNDRWLKNEYHDENNRNTYNKLYP